jgi:hypothetical protein
MTRSAETDFWWLEQAEWLYEEIVYRTHMRTRNRIGLACLLPAGWGWFAGFSPLALALTMAYVWIVWTVLYEREVARFLPAKVACYVMLVSVSGGLDLETGAAT